MILKSECMKKINEDKLMTKSDELMMIDEKEKKTI